MFDNKKTFKYTDDGFIIYDDNRDLFYILKS